MGQYLLVDFCDGNERQVGEAMHRVRHQVFLSEVGRDVVAETVLVDRSFYVGDGGVDTVAVDLGVGDGADGCALTPG